MSSLLSSRTLEDSHQRYERLVNKEISRRNFVRRHRACVEKISISGSGSGPGNIDRAIWVRARMHLAPSSALSLQGAHNPVVTRQQWLRQHVRETSSKVECKSSAIREKRVRAIQEVPLPGMGYDFTNEFYAC